MSGKQFIVVSIVVLTFALTAAAEEKAPPAELDDLAHDVAQLRADMLKLQQTFESYMGGMLADLKEENEQLRQELRQVYREKDLAPPAVPSPDKELIEQVLNERLPGETAVVMPEDEKSEPAKDAAAENTPPPSTPQPVKDPAIKKAIKKEGYAVVAEWGRTPEEAEALGKSASSLKGMICVVDPKASDEELTELGTKFRKQFSDYNNVNIEVFDDLASAQQYNAQHTAPVERRVLSVSKHTASGRDTVVLIRDGMPTEIPVE